MSLMTFLWAIAFGICPQRPSHSLFLDGQPMPIEARMAGMFGGFLLSAASFMVLGHGRALRLPSKSMTAVLMGFVALMGADGLNAFFFDLGWPHLYPPANWLRLATGLLAGLAFAGFLIPSFNDTVWDAGLDRSPIAGVRDLIAALSLEAVYFLAALSGAKPFLYPVSMIAILGVLGLLGTVSSILLGALAAGRFRRVSRPRELIPLMIGGLTVTVFVLASVSGIRYGLFGLGPIELPPVEKSL